MKYLQCVLVLLAILGQAQANADLEALLEQVRKDAQQSTERNREREERFLARRNEQKKLLKEAESQAARLESEAETLRKELAQLAKKIEAQQAELDERSGDLQGVAGAVRDGATTALEQFRQSLVSLDEPERLGRVSALTQISEVPAASELESLWLELQREATLLAQSPRLRIPVADTDGEVREMNIRRHGGFALRDDDGRYLRWRGGGAVPEVIARQPQPGLTDRVAGASADGLIVDPTGGLLLGLQESRPTLRERIAQGGIIGFIILGLGAIGLVLGLVQWAYLLWVGARVSAQYRSPLQPNENNPLGRILMLREHYANKEFESLELAADEAVMRELPRLERLQDTVRLMAAVAPLLGLLGTVTGMIETFQAITLFGTGDPKLMAGGISQALMTTVLGLVVAVPLLFLHSLMVARGRGIVQTLDQQSAGLLASLRESRATAEAV